MKMKVNNNYYNIYFVNSEHPKLVKHNAVALCDKIKKEILIPFDAPNTDDLLRHEIVHAVIYEYGMNEKVEWDEESVCVFYQNYYKIIEDILKKCVSEAKV